MPRSSRISTAVAVIALAIVIVSLLHSAARPAAADTLLGGVGLAAALGAGFTYQGYLTRNGAPIDSAGACDLHFSLWYAASAGTQIGNPQLVSAVNFVKGAFAITLNDGG